MNELGSSWDGMLAGAILAGGEAARYGGRPKGLLPVGDGRTILERELDAMRATGLKQLAVIANEPEPYRRFGVEVVPDLRPGNGPLGGIEAALEHYRGRCTGVLFLPCDLPAIGAEEMARLAEAFAARRPMVAVAVVEDSFWQPLCAVVHIAARSAVSRALDAGRLSPRLLWRELGAVPVRFADPAPFFNVNTPADFARWRAAVEGGTCRSD